MVTVDNAIVDEDAARVDGVDVGESVGSIELALGKVTVGSVGIERVGTVRVKLGTFGTGTVGAVPPGAVVQSFSTSLQANPLSQQTSTAQLHVGPPLHCAIQISMPDVLLQGEPIGQQPGPTAQLVSPAAQTSWRRGRLWLWPVMKAWRRRGG